MIVLLIVFYNGLLLMPNVLSFLIAVLAVFLIFRYIIRSKNRPKTEKKDTKSDDAASAEPYQILKRLLQCDSFATCISPQYGQSLKADAKVEKFVRDKVITVSFSDGFSCYTYAETTFDQKYQRVTLSSSYKEIAICEAILEHNRLLCAAHPEYDVNELNREASIQLLEAKDLGHRHVCSDCGNTYIKISAFTPCPYCELRAKENETRQADIQRKAAEQSAQKAEKPKSSPAPTAVNVKNADAWRAEVHRQAEQRAQEDKQRKAAEPTKRIDSDQSAYSEPKENTPEGVTVLRGLPDVWVVLGTGLPKKWPAIDVQGFFHVFTAEEAANAFAQPNGFGVEKMTGAALCECLKEWQRYGITHILLHQGNETRKFLEKELGFGNNFNSDLQETMIRYLQTKTLNIDGAVETAKIFWVLLCKMIPERLFLVPFCFEGEDINAPVEDNTLRLFPNAARLIMKQRAEGKILLFDGYPFADKADGRPMHFRSLRNGATGLEVLSVYTDFHEMLPIWKGRAHFALATFDDFKDNYQPTCGVMINPISQALLLEPKDIEEMKKN